MGIKHESQASDEQAAGPDGNSAATAITAKAPSTRRTALGVTAAATAAFLADKALLAPGAARASGEVVESINGKTGKVTLGASEVGAIAEAEKGAASGVAELDAHGSVLGAAAGASTTSLGAGNLGTFSKGQANLALGTQALPVLDEGNWNTAIAGEESLYSLTKGQSNICIGNATLRAIKQTEYMLAIGDNALLVTTKGGANVFIGFSAGEFLEEAEDTTAIGNGAITSANEAGTLAKAATAIGNAAMASAKQTYFSVAIGSNAHDKATINAYDVAIGYKALDGLSESEGNTAVGYKAGEKATGKSTKNVFIGYEAGPAAEAAVNDQLYIGNAASATPLIKGVFPNSELQLNSEKLGFNKKTPVSLIGENLSTGALKVTKTSPYGFETEAQAKAAAKFAELFSKWAHESGLTA